MDVLVLTPWFPNSLGGWPAPFIADSATALAQQGFRVRVQVFRAWHPKFLGRYVSPMHTGRIQGSDFPDLESVGQNSHLAFPGRHTRAWSNYLLDRKVAACMSRELRRRAPDVVHVHTEGLAPGALASVAGRLPVLVTLHGENTNRHYVGDPRQALRFSRALKEASLVAIVGEPMRTYAAQLAGREDLIVIPNGVALPPRRASLGKCKNFFRLVSVGNLLPEKGQDILIGALADVKKTGHSNWSLKIIGHGSYERELKALSERHNLQGQIEFVGTVSNAMVFDELANSDVFVLPSYRESFGVAYLEAMAVGLLTVGVEGQGPATFIKHGESGVLVAPRDTAQLSALLCKLFSGEMRNWMEIAERGRHAAQTKYSWRSHGEVLASALKRARREFCGLTPLDSAGNLR